MEKCKKYHAACPFCGKKDLLEIIPEDLDFFSILMSCPECGSELDIIYRDKNIFVEKTSLFA